MKSPIFRPVSHLGLIFFCMALTSLPAQGEFVLMSDDEQIKMYVDKDTVQWSGNIVHFWQQHTYNRPQEERTGKVDTYLYDTTIDCNSRVLRLLKFVTYYKGEKVNEGVDPAPPPHAIPPGTYYGLLADLFCKTRQSSASKTDQQKKQKKSLVASVQQALKDQGYDPGPVDGIYGERTKSAIRAYQDRHGLEVTGKPSATLLQQLKAPASPGSPVQTYRNESLGFQISYPNDWAQMAPVFPGITWKIGSNNGSGPDVVTISVAGFTGDEQQFMTELKALSNDAYLKDIRKRFPEAKIAERRDTYLGGFAAYSVTIKYPIRSLDFETEGVTVQVVCLRRGKIYVVNFETFTPFFVDSYLKFVGILASYSFLL